MDKELLTKLIERNLSTRKIGDEVGKCGSSIKYWLKKYGLKTNFIPGESYIVEYGETKICYKCKTECKISDFFNSRKLDNRYSYCKHCLNKMTVENQRKLKKKCIEYKGGKCVICSYDDYDGALDFHHLNPGEKDFSIAEGKNRSFDNIKSELDKCVLLCCRCHREVEFRNTDLSSYSMIKPSDKFYEILNVNKISHDTKISKRSKNCECGVNINKYSEKCPECSKKKQRYHRPTESVLMDSINSNGLLETSKVYNVHVATVRKWVRLCNRSLYK